MDVSAKLVTLIDRLCHPSSDEIDMLATAHAIRRVAKGNTASSYLRSNQYTDTKTEIASLRAVIDNLHAELAALEQENDTLREQTLFPSERESDDDYPFEEVQHLLYVKFGKINGSLTAWSRYSESLHFADPTSPLVTPSLLQTWRRKQTYPVWAVEQLQAMPPEDRCGYQWSPDAIDFLCQLHQADYSKSNAQLAKECSNRFGFPINDNSIKSKLDYLRRLNRIPRRRPKD